MPGRRCAPARGDPQQPSGHPRWRLLVLAGIVLVGAFVYFFRLATPSWNFDESHFASLGHQFLLGHFASGAGEDPYLGIYLIALIPRLVGSESVAAVRVLPALAGLATGGVLFVFARRVAGYWAGLLALAMWVLLPHAAVMAGVSLAAIKIERFGLLDVLHGACSWRGPCMRPGAGWIPKAGPGQWQRECAAHWPRQSKLPGALVLIPIAVLAIITPGRDRKRLVQMAVVVVLCPVILWLSLLPATPDAVHLIREMVNLGRLHQAFGHPTIIAGRLYTRNPPWWANAWFMWRGVGPFGTVALVGSALAGLVLLERRLAIYLGAAVMVPFVSLAGFYFIALPHYYYIWLAPLNLLAALGLHRLLSLRTTGRQQWRAILGAALMASLAIGAVITIVDVARLKPSDYRLAGAVLRRVGLDRGSVFVLGYGAVLAAYIPEVHVSSQPAQADAVVIDPLQERRGDPTGVQSFVLTHRQNYVTACADRLRIFIRRDVTTARLRNTAPGPRLPRQLTATELAAKGPRDLAGARGHVGDQLAHAAQAAPELRIPDLDWEHRVLERGQGLVGRAELIRGAVDAVPGIGGQLQRRLLEPARR